MVARSQGQVGKKTPQNCLFCLDSEVASLQQRSTAGCRGSLAAVLGWMNRKIIRMY